MAHVTTGCRDCKKCTNSGVANLGRNSGRFGVGVMTLGLSELAMTGTKNCAVCGHKLSLHEGETIGAGKKQKGPEAGWYDEVRSGRKRWWDGNEWGIYADEYSAPPMPAPVRATPPSNDVAGQLAQLAAMHAQGTLSDEEFAAAKSQVLG